MNTATKRRGDLPDLWEVFDRARMDYRAGKRSRFRPTLSGVSSMGSGADYHYASEPEFLRMIETARDAERNNPIIGQGITRLVDNVVQTGFKVDPETGDGEINKRLKGRWDAWAEDPDACHSEQEIPFHGEGERLLFRSVIRDGDILTLPLGDGSLQYVEAHRLRTPRNTKRNVVHGVLLDESARRKEYWLTKENLTPRQRLEKVSDVEAYPARDSQGRRQVLHIYRPERFSQRRGVTAFAPIADLAGMHDDLQFAALVAAQAQTCWAILHELGEDPKVRPPGSQDTAQHGEQTIETNSGTQRVLEGLGPGMEYFGRPGEKVRGFAPTIPAPQFFQHAMLILGIISVNLNLPLAVLLLDPSRTNFSGWRGAVDQARQTFRVLQSWLVARVHTPIYLWKLRRWIAEDEVLAAAALRDDLDLTAHTWHSPSWPYIEPLKDIGADLLEGRNGLNSWRRIQARRGRDWDQVAEEIAEDNAKLIIAAWDKAEELKQSRPGLDVTWRELAHLPTPDGLKLTLDTSDPAEEPAAGDGGGTNNIPRGADNEP